MNFGMPTLVYFHGFIKGKYLATWPVFIRADDRRSVQFSVSVDNKLPTSDEIADGPETAIGTFVTSVRSSPDWHGSPLSV
jgi:hypothetical protein